jgi:ribosome biogenesis protein ERB1
MIVPPIWTAQKTENTKEVCEKGFHAEGSNKSEAAGVKWSRGKNDEVMFIVKTSNTVQELTWHRRGDYFATVAPQGKVPLFFY